MNERLNKIFQKAFDRPDLTVGPETTAADIEDWDSFMHITLIVGIEEEFGVSFSTEEIGSFSCVGDVMALLKEKGAAE